MRRARAGLALLLLLALPLAAAAEGDEPGRKIFTEIAQPPCALCHTLAAAGSAGAIGPVLDDLKPDKERVAKAVLDGVGAMPPYRDKLTKEQIEAVAGFVSRAAAGK